MRLGLHAIGIGSGARRDVIDVVARAAEGSSPSRMCAVNPKPVRDRRIPVIVGGASDAARRRVATMGDGWYGFNLADPEAVVERIERLSALCAEAGRELRDLYLAVALEGGEPDDGAALRAIGIDELVLVAAPPNDPAEVGDWLAALTERWPRPRADLRALGPGSAPDLSST